MLWIIIGVLLGLTGLGYVFLWKKGSESKEVKNKETKVRKVPTENLGQIQIFFASQTGTAAKMSETFSEELAEHGFTGIVIDLKDITHEQFEKNQISVFFMANTGEGQAPDNCVEFMKLLEHKVDLEGDRPCWENINYAIFGLGDTQYEHFNKIAKDTDKFLEKNGANRIYVTGLGDNNCSLEDDYNEWKEQIWQVLSNFRRNNPHMKKINMKKKYSEDSMKERKNVKYLDNLTPIYANYKFITLDEIVEEDGISQILDFKTKASLKGSISQVQNIIQRRQDNKNGSTLQLEIQMEGQPEYQTAGNIALWPTNDPTIIHDAAEYFHLNLDQVVDVQTINYNKKFKLNFVRPLTIQALLEQYLDLQFKITKGLLKKLYKFPSSNPDYFLQNSNAKTTDEYKKLVENQFSYLFKLVQKHEVRMSFEDFVQLSDSIGPRLFTIASSWKAQKNVVIAASIAENGLISKLFQRSPARIKAELRPSSFKDFQKWKKVIFVSAGTGFAPFRGFLQEKQLLKLQKPLISLYFGCRYRDSDFIYRQQIEKWHEEGIINRLSLAFSREGEKKVYVQHLLGDSKDELNQFINDEECGMYICGSTGMGSDVNHTILQFLQEKENTEKQSEQILERLEKDGRIIKELW